jgi:hypothetical protein
LQSLKMAYLIIRSIIKNMIKLSMEYFIQGKGKLAIGNIDKDR